MLLDVDMYHINACHLKKNVKLQGTFRKQTYKLSHILQKMFSDI